MSVVTRVVRRFNYPAESPWTSLALYYGLLLAVSVLLFRFVPPIRPAFTGQRLVEMASTATNLLADRSPALAEGLVSLEFAFLLGVAMVGATLLMLPTAVVYMVTRRKKGFDQSVVQTMVVLALAVAGVVVIVRNSLALAFSLAGIVGAVRFRTSLPDTRDMLYIFVSIGVGLTAGVEALAAAFVLSLLFNYTVLAFHLADFGMCEMGRPASYLLHTTRLLDPDPSAAAGEPSLTTSTAGASVVPAVLLAEGGAYGKAASKEFNSVLLVRAKDPDTARPVVESFLGMETKRWALAEVEKNANGTETVLKYLLRMGKKSDPSAIEDALLHMGAPNVIGARIH